MSRPRVLDVIDSILADPSTSRWLKGALTSALDRDPVDVELDAIVLRRVLADRRKLLELPSTHELDRVPGHL